MCCEDWASYDGDHHIAWEEGRPKVDNQSCKARSLYEKLKIGFGLKQSSSL